MLLNKLEDYREKRLITEIEKIENERIQQEIGNSWILILPFRNEETE